MKKTMMWVALASLGAAPWAQAVVRQDAVTKTTRAGDAESRYAALVEAFDKEMEAFTAARKKVSESEEYAAARAARDNAKLQELMAGVPPVDNAEHGKRFIAAAREYAGKPDAVRFLAWTATNGRDSALVEQALQTLVGEHFAAPEWKDLSFQVNRKATVLPAEKQWELYEKLLAHPDKEVQANALYARWEAIARARGESGFSDEQKAEAEKGKERILELAPDSLVGLKVRGPEFQAERLQIGMEAPDIVGKDLDGVEFKLSDYRGKVVMLDFLGDW